MRRDPAKRSPGLLAFAVALAALAVASLAVSVLQARNAEGIRFSYRLWSSVDPNYSALPSMLEGSRAAEVASDVSRLLSVACGVGSLVAAVAWAVRRFARRVRNT